MTRTTIRVYEHDFSKFKKYAKQNMSDTSKELRKLILDYNKRHEAKNAIDTDSML